MKKLINLYHRIVAALILLKYKDLEKAKERSAKYYIKHVE
jgi:hypothetical protein